MEHRPTLPADTPPLPSAPPRFTTRFGMVRGGPTAQERTPLAQGPVPTVSTYKLVPSRPHTARLPPGKPSSMRSGRLHVSPRLQLRPLSPSSPGGLTCLEQRVH